ncbi:hypothetical protein [Asticcacaulis solisilvae]|uniref:hypothetical protein n=1 Tax=Asticcacaulis solisilvae TaxID=1217274 RepID=UPI003FD735A0
MTQHRKKPDRLAQFAVVACALAAVIAVVSAQKSHGQSQTANTAATGARPIAASTAPSQAAAAKPAPILLRRALPPAPVQWQAALQSQARNAQIRRPDSLALKLPKAQLDQIRLPVVLPRSGLINTAKAKLLSFGDAYALNMPQPKGTQLTMYGNRSFVQADKGAISSRPVVRLAGVPEDIRISQTEDGWTATFTRYGVVYSIDLSCDDTASADCTSDTYLRKAIAEFTDVSVGAQAQTEAKAPAKVQVSPSLFDQLGKTFSAKKGG